MHVSEVPEHDPLQPTQVEPGSGVAVNVTLVFGANATEHPEPLPQETPAGLLQGTPLPVRVIVTLDARRLRLHLHHRRPRQSIASG